MNPQYSRTILQADVQALLTDTVDTTNLNLIINKSVIDVLSDIDMRSAIRRTAVSPNLFDDIFEYACPTDLKADKVIDIQPQIKRGRFDEWILMDPTEFDRKKEDRRVDRFGDPIELKNTQWLGDNICAVSTYDFIRKILISRPIEDNELVISQLDSVGTWIGFGDGTNLTRDADDYVKESASINWDISAVGGTTAGIVNSSVTSFDISEYKGIGSAFVWAYITSTTNLTNFILRVGSSSSAYYYITITTAHDGNAFQAGWNLLRFDFLSKATTGSPTDTAFTYVAIYMTKAAGKVSETDYRFDWLVLKKGDHYYTHYYSKYGWQTNAGVYLEKSTADTDLLNVDTDEYNIIVDKCAENIERYILKKQDEAEQRKRDYNEKKKNYVAENASRAMVMSQSYFNV